MGFNKVRSSLKVENRKLFDYLVAEKYITQGYQSFDKHVRKAVEGIMNDKSLDKILDIEAKFAEDANSSPFITPRYYQLFMESNKERLSFKEAPLDKVLMVITESLGSLDNGSSRLTDVSRGSLIVKLSENHICCIRGTYWQIASSGTTSYTFEQHGYFDVVKDKISGGLKLIKDITL